MAYTLENIDRINDNQIYGLSEIATIIGISKAMLYQRRKVMEDYYRTKGNAKIPLRLVGRQWKHVLTSEAMYVEGTSCS